MYEEEQTVLAIYAPIDLYSPMHNGLDACISITRASGKGVGPVKWHRADMPICTNPKH
jgi:hypothetical protein